MRKPHAPSKAAGQVRIASKSRTAGDLVRILTVSHCAALRCLCVSGSTMASSTGAAESTLQARLEAEHDEPTDDPTVGRLTALVDSTCGCPSQLSANLFGIGSTVNHRNECLNFVKASLARASLNTQWSAFCDRYGHPLDRPRDVADRGNPKILADYCAQLFALVQAIPNKETTAAMLPLMCFIEEVAWSAYSHKARMAGTDIELKILMDTLRPHVSPAVRDAPPANESKAPTNSEYRDHRNNA
jgi:hypothetical protein